MQLCNNALTDHSTVRIRSNGESQSENEQTSPEQYSPVQPIRLEENPTPNQEESKVGTTEMRVT